MFGGGLLGFVTLLLDTRQLFIERFDVAAKRCEFRLPLQLGLPVSLALRVQLNQQFLLALLGFGRNRFFFLQHFLPQLLFQFAERTLTNFGQFQFTTPS